MDETISTVSDDQITQPTRVKNFAQFFKNYMSIWSIIVAALPIPIASFNLIPVFDYQKEVFSTYTTLFCFLLLGFIFFSRHKMARYFFPSFFYNIRRETILIAVEDEIYRRRNVAHRDSMENEENMRSNALRWWDKKYAAIRRTARIVGSLPLILIITSLICAFGYNFLMDSYLVHADYEKKGLSGIAPPPKQGTILFMLYLGIFMFAEAAFILMAIKEYLQDLLKLTDQSLMKEDFRQYEEKSIQMKL